MGNAETSLGDQGLEERADAFFRELVFADLSSDLPENLSGILEQGDVIERDIGDVALAASRTTADERDDRMVLHRNALGLHAVTTSISSQEFGKRSLVVIESDLHGSLPLVYDESGKRIHPREIDASEHAGTQERRKVYAKLFNGIRKK